MKNVYLSSTEIPSTPGFLTFQAREEIVCRAAASSFVYFLTRANDRIESPTFSFNIAQPMAISHWRQTKRVV